MIQYCKPLYIIVFGAESSIKLSDTRVRNFIFTIQENENATSGETTKNALQGNPNVKALFIGGLEKAPTTGKSHRHCVVSFHNKKSLEQAIKLLAPHHVEEMRGSVQQAIIYALKDNQEFLINTYNFIQERDNEQRVIELILNGATLIEIMQQCPKTTLNRYHNIEKLIARLSYQKPQE